MNEPSIPAEPKNPRLNAVLREYLERVDRGESIDRAAFLSQHAEIADELRSFLAVEEELRKLADGESSPASASISTKSFADRGQETVAPRSMAKQTAESAGTGLAAQFGRYRILRALGQGAMGTVYLAEDTQLQRQVALKKPHFQDNPTEEMLERFYREARAAATLRHANICPVFDVGQIDGKHYISMAYIDGHPLSAFIQPDKPQTERQILIVIRKLALALQEAHDHGIVHRDLKPANIMIDKRGEPIIMDFGLARQVRHEEDVRLTQSGMLIGTPAFMSPEQVEGEPDKIGPPADQYSLGVILYELLMGQLPFRGSVIAVMGQILSKEPPPPSRLRPDLDSRIETVCLRMMAKIPTDRFGSLSAVAEELATILKNPAAKSAPKAPPKATTSTTPPDRPRTEAAASQVLKSVKQKPVTQGDVASLEELARKFLVRHDYDQVIQIIEQIPQERRTAELQALLEQARDKTDEIAFLICEIDEAVRLNDQQAALKKTDELLKIKPGHHRARAVQKEFSGYGAGGAARIGPLYQLTQRWNEGGWIPWSALAFGLAVFGVMTGLIVVYLRGTAIVIDVQNPDVQVDVAVQGTTVTVTGPKKERVTVEPGNQELKISYAGLQTVTRSFTLNRGDKKIVTVSLADGKLLAKLGAEVLLEQGLKSSPAVPGAKPPNNVDQSSSSGRKQKPIETLPVDEKKTEPPATAGSGDLDRRAALWALSIGGEVGVNGQRGGIRASADLPKEPFRLTFVNLYKSPQATDAGLAHFKHCKSLRQLGLALTPITDAGLAHFKDIKSLRLLALDRTKVTDTGMANFQNCKDLRTLSLIGTEVGDEGLAYFKDCKNLTNLHLYDARVSDAGLANFKGSKKVKVLEINGTQVTDRGLANFVACDRLESLWLVGTSVSDAGLEYFKDCKDLALLNVQNTKVTGASLAHVQDWPKLTHLSLTNQPVSDAALAHLKDCKKLTHLELINHTTTDHGLVHLKDCKKLTVLSVGPGKITDAGLVHLKTLADLKELRLWGTRVSDAGLEHLPALTKLTRLDLKESKGVTAAGVKKLAAAIPNCMIEWDGGVINP